MTIHPTQQSHAFTPDQRIDRLGDDFYPSFIGPVTVLDCDKVPNGHSTLISGSQVSSVDGKIKIRPRSVFLVSEANGKYFESWHRLNEEVAVTTVAQAEAALDFSGNSPSGVQGVDWNLRGEKPSETLQAKLNH